MGKAAEVKIHKTAIIGKNVKIGSGTTIWAFAQIGDNAKIGKNCVLGNGCYIDRIAVIGDNAKIMNKALVFRGCEIGNNVFIGPGVVFANDKNPRAQKTRQIKKSEWKINDNASIGANSTVLADVNIGKFAMLGAGSVVTKNIPDYGIAYGNPAKLHGFACECGEKTTLEKKEKEFCILKCEKCGKLIKIKNSDYSKIND